MYVYVYVEKRTGRGFRSTLKLPQIIACNYLYHPLTEIWRSNFWRGLIHGRDIPSVKTQLKPSSHSDLYHAIMRSPSFGLPSPNQITPLVLRARASLSNLLLPCRLRYTDPPSLCAVLVDHRRENQRTRVHLEWKKGARVVWVTAWSAYITPPLALSVSATLSE